ncbi:MAG: DUF134 domain-containing protein [Desulfobacteraceae bacterium]|nr:DUF134 domain-containing protein [Desulfobacteraceae bacterium]
MPRRKCCRRIGGKPPCRVFGPVGAPVALLEEVFLGEDEFEALRLADLEGLYHEEAAMRMDVSRQTFGRIVESARRKVARALAGGFVLRIEGGVPGSADAPTFRCNECRRTWNGMEAADVPEECPACRSRDFCRADACDPSPGTGGGCPRNRCREQ